MATSLGFGTSTAHDVAQTIRSQIGPGVFMSLGASHLGAGTMAHTKGGPMLPSLIFQARILPFKKNGERAEAPRVMYVVVSLTPNDTYEITVSYYASHSEPRADHFHATDVYAEDLSRTLLALDYDGDEVLNPRFA